MTAHPRSRGENRRATTIGSQRGGSSPLTRGKLLLGGVCHCRVRLIPAHAGKTSRTPRREILCAGSSPLTRGKRGWFVVPPGGWGSSPLTRGKPVCCRLWPDGDGLIPAHAGKTHPPTNRSGRWAAHPRSRGENRFSPPDWPLVSGSSPLTRGKLTPSLPDPLDRGLIPAHAGKTPPERGRRGLQTAHPRSRGENRLATGSVGRASGSSPLTRGKLSFLWCVVSDERLIPAHAGKTAKNALKRSLTPGSSPLTRGKRSSTTLSLACQRLIPAHAGKTNQSARRQDRTAAHPRSRGENTSPS
mgnify:CR=1 FL=1